MGNGQSAVLLIHSILRYLVLIATLVVAVQSVISMTSKKALGKGNKMAALMMMIMCDLQLLVGLAVYMFGNQASHFADKSAFKDSYTRFYALEHPVGMILGIVLVHVGYSRLKKNWPDEKKSKQLFWCSFLALFIFFYQTPWPYKKLVGRPYLPGTTMAQ